MLQARSSGGRWDFGIRVKGGFDAALWQGAGAGFPRRRPPGPGGPSKPGGKPREAVPEDSACLPRGPAQITAGPRRSREGEADGDGVRSRSQGKRG